ncbi:MAG: hypothetical protein V1739_03975 [Candidatus Omnitrophota bacterium]
MKHIIKLGLLLLILLLSISDFAFSEEPFASFEKTKTKEEKVAFINDLTLKEIVVLGSQYADKYGVGGEWTFGFLLGCLGPRWEAELSTIPETISIALNEKINPEWKKFITDYFKDVKFYEIYEDNNKILPVFLNFINDKSKDQKTKVVLLETIGCWFDGYKQRFTDPLDEEDASEKNFKLVHKQANMTINALDNIIQDKEINKEGAVAAKNLYTKIHKIYLDEDNILPLKFKNIRSFKHIKAKLQKSSNIFGDKRK